MNGLALLLNLADYLADARPLSEEERLRICNAIACYGNGHCPTLDQAFAVDRLPSQHDPRTSFRLATRNELYRQYAHQFYHGVSVNQQAERIHADLDRYRNGGWRHDRLSENLPDKPGSKRCLMFEILRCQDRTLSIGYMRSLLAQ